MHKDFVIVLAFGAGYQELIDKMDDKRLEADCEFLKQEQQRGIQGLLDKESLN